VDSHGGPTHRLPLSPALAKHQKPWMCVLRIKMVMLNIRRRVHSILGRQKCPLTWWDIRADARSFVGLLAPPTVELSDEAWAMSFSLHQPKNHVGLSKTSLPWPVLCFPGPVLCPSFRGLLTVVIFRFYIPPVAPMRW